MELNWWGTRTLDRHNPVPMYQQLSDLLARVIREGQFKPGDQLPSENDLISHFQISRSVVRQALNTLVRQGLINTEHGRGSFVAGQKIVKPLDILQSYTASMKKVGIEVDVRILTKSIVYPGEEIAMDLALKPKDRVLLLERVAFANGSPLNLLTSHIALGNWGESQLMKFEGGSLYEFLAKECNIHLSSSRNNIEIIFAGENESRLLNQARGSVLLQITGVSYNQDRIPVEHSCVVYPASMFRFQFDSFKLGGAGDDKPLMIR